MTRARPIRTRVYQLARRLPRLEALTQAHKRDKRAGYWDHRGFTYDPTTGRATLT